MTASKPDGIPYRDEVSPLVTLADLEKPASITDRDLVRPDLFAARCSGCGHLVRHHERRPYLDGVTCKTRVAKEWCGCSHTHDEALLSSDWLAARDEAVRREVLAKAIETVGEINPFAARPRGEIVKDAVNRIGALLPGEATPHADKEAGS